MSNTNYYVYDFENKVKFDNENTFDKLINTEVLSMIVNQNNVYVRVKALGNIQWKKLETDATLTSTLGRLLNVNDSFINKLNNIEKYILKYSGVANEFIYANASGIYYGYKDYICRIDISNGEKIEPRLIFDADKCAIINDKLYANADFGFFEHYLTEYSFKGSEIHMIKICERIW